MCADEEVGGVVRGGELQELLIWRWLCLAVSSVLHLGGTVFCTVVHGWFRGVR